MSPSCSSRLAPRPLSAVWKKHWPSSSRQKSWMFAEISTAAAMTLSQGSNQYSCSRCNKKVDALKGLKFTKLPYILTLQLKRFDFDYTTMRRVKLHEKHESS